MNADEKIWRYLKSAGLNDFGVAGLMGNLFAESGLNPKNLQNPYEKKLGISTLLVSGIIGAIIAFGK